MKRLLILSMPIVLFCISSCVATQDDVGGLYARQNRLEARVDRLSKQMRVASGGSTTGASTEVNDQVFQLETKVYDLEQKISMLENQIDYLEGTIQGQGGVRPVPSPGAPNVATGTPPASNIPPAPSQENVQQPTQEQVQP
ncbi:MAG: hypothetical protein ACR2NC_01940, partial [Thermodesulfobacteriota bacterium]